MQITIPSRHNVPSAELFVELKVAGNNKLGDRPIILLVPGGPGGNHTVFNAVQDQLLKYGDLILFDPRGCGLSAPSDSKHCSIDQYIEDIEAIRKYFNLPKFILLGGSYGSMASVGYATKYNHHLSKLILIAGAPSYKFLETAKINLEKIGTKEQIEAAKDLFQGTFKDADHFKKFYQIASTLYLVNHIKDPNPPTIKPNIPYNIEITNYGFGNFLRDFSYENDLNKIACQTLIIVGDSDWINDPIHAKFMADNIAQAKLVILERCGHFVWVDQPDAFYNAIDEFLK